MTAMSGLNDDVTGGAVGDAVFAASLVSEPSAASISRNSASVGSGAVVGGGLTSGGGASGTGTSGTPASTGWANAAREAAAMPTRIKIRFTWTPCGSTPRHEDVVDARHAVLRNEGATIRRPREATSSEPVGTARVQEDR